MKAIREVGASQSTTSPAAAPIDSIPLESVCSFNLGD